MVDRYVWENSKSTPEDIQMMSFPEKQRLAREIYRMKLSGLSSNGAWDKGLTPLMEAQLNAIKDSLLFLHDPSVDSLSKAATFLINPEPRQFRNPDVMLILGTKLPNIDVLSSNHWNQ